MNLVPLAFSATALLALSGASLSAQVVNERSFLEVRRQPFRLQWVNSLAIQGPWLAAGGTDIEGFSALAFYRREGATWVPEPLPGGGDVDLDGNRLVVADSENLSTLVFRRDGGQWEIETYLPTNFASLHGNRLLTANNDFFGPFVLDAWKLETGGAVPDGVLVPDQPQEYGSCCGTMTVWGNTAAFLARGASSEDTVQVFVRERGRWNKQTELVPSGGGTLGRLALWGGTLVALRYDDAGASALVWERDNGTWHEQAVIAPGGSLWSLALEGDTLALGHDPSVGLVSVYERTGTSWVPRARLAARNGQKIGPSVAIDGRTVVTTTHGIVPRLNRIYVFQLPELPEPLGR